MLSQLPDNQTRWIIISSFHCVKEYNFPRYQLHHNLLLTQFPDAMSQHSITRCEADCVGYTSIEELLASKK